MRVHAIAREITPEQMATLFAIKLASRYPTQCPIGGWHWASPVYIALTRWKLVKPEFVKGWPRGWRRSRITDLGELVLLRVAELAMVEVGRMESLDAEEVA